ncbi:MAG: tetratricopeptide repeat protein [Anaerolineae bacterium]|nr:tetratricopeptide repeat protein [Anaerolineae bacterium]
MGEATTPHALRREIRAAEIEVAALDKNVGAQNVIALYRRLDRIEVGTGQLTAAGLDLRAEQARIETIHNTLGAKAPDVYRVIVRAGGWQWLRDQSEAAPDSWWWFLDHQVRQARAHRRRHALWGSLALVAVLIVAVLLYVRFLRPDRATRARLAYLNRAESLVEQGDYAGALSLYGEALALAPDDPEIYLMLGVLHEALEQEEHAAAYYAASELRYGERSVFLGAKSQRYLVLGWYEASETAALEAIELDRANAIAYCHLSSAYEAQGQISDAIEAVRRCAELAQEQGQDALYVTATTRLGLLLRAPAPDVRPIE